MKKVLKAVLLAAAMLAASFAGAQSAQIVTTAQGFSVTAPATLVAQAPAARTTTSGLPYTFTYYTAVLPNGDTYAVAVAEYNIQLDAATSLPNSLNAIVSSMPATIIRRMDNPISGQPGLLASLKLNDRT